MHRIVSAISMVALAFSLVASAAPANAAVAGYDSAYAGESAFLTLEPGASGTFTVFFANTGTTSWVKGSGSQVDLAACLEDKTTCNSQDAKEAPFNSGWLSATRYTTQTQSTVAPGQIGTFTYNVAVPAGTTAGTYRFNGALVLASTGADIRNEGYYQDVTVPAPTTPPPPTGAAASPPFGTPADNTINQEHTVTFTGIPAGTASATVIASANVGQAADGTYSFVDTNSNKQADGICSGDTTITNVNNVTQAAGSTCVFGFTVPASGQVVIRINSATPNQRVRLVLWQDKNANGQIDMSTAGLSDGTRGTYDATTDGVLVSSGIKYYWAAEGTFGQTISCQPIYRHNSTSQRFSAGATSAGSTAWDYDANDTFRINGVLTTLATFKSSIVASATGAGSTVSVTYDPNPAGFSEFNICNNAGYTAPNPTASVGSFDGGATANDVRLTFTAPSTNATSSYGVQRATRVGTDCSEAQTPSSNYVTIGNATAGAGEAGSFTDFNRPDGTYCYRLRVINPNTGAESVSATPATATVPGSADTTQPTSTAMELTTSAGLAGTMDTGDKFHINFSEPMTIASNALIRFTDSDCGQAAGQNSGPPTCSGSLSQTVGDVVCGTNATCTYTASTQRLDVTLTGNPTIVAAGSTAGVQYRATVTDASGITDAAGNPWNITGSADRNIGPNLGE